MSVTAAAFDFSPVIWLGKSRGEWPHTAFPSEDQAVTWLKNNPNGRVIGPIQVDPSLPAKRIEERVETRWVD